MRTSTIWFLCLTPISLILFFPLFFKLNYPEIIRHGWPVTRCHILQSAVIPRYCCETQCNGCTSAPSGAQQCSSLISSIDSGFSPTACAANTSSCPAGVGLSCDGGSYCCSTCCSTCTTCSNSCSTTCSGVPSTCSTSCTPVCTTYTCNCYCCSSIDHQDCTLSCPSCFSVQLNLTYYTHQLALETTTYTQDFQKNNNSASNFYEAHLANSTSTCYYDPKDLSQVSFDVSFTKWKWAITAVFGMFPLLVCILYFVWLSGIPQRILGWIAGFFKWIAAGIRSWKAKRALRKMKRVAGSQNDDTSSEVPPPYKA